MTDLSTNLSALGAGPRESPAPLEEPGQRVIAPAKRRLKLRQLPGHVSVIRVLAARDFKVKYQQSLLGPLWLIIQPLALLVAFLVAFKGLGHATASNEPYVVFTLAGLSAWSFFQASMTIGTSSVISNLNYVRYTPCPRTAFPIAASIASLPSVFLVGLAAIIGALVTGHLSPRVVLLPVGLLWLFSLSIGILGLTSSLAVRYRDMISVVPLVLQVGVFVSPVGYSIAALSPTVRHLVELNPLTGVIEAWRWMLLQGYQASVAAILISLAWTVAFLVIGWRVFARLETTMADEI